MCFVLFRGKKAKGQPPCPPLDSPTSTDHNCVSLCDRSWAQKANDAALWALCFSYKVAIIIIIVIVLIIIMMIIIIIIIMMMKIIIMIIIIIIIIMMMIIITIIIIIIIIMVHILKIPYRVQRLGRKSYHYRDHQILNNVTITTIPIYIY